MILLDGSFSFSFSFSEVLVVVLTLVSGALAYLIKRRDDEIDRQKNNLEQALAKTSEKKREVYYLIFDWIFGVLLRQKNKTPGEAHSDDERKSDAEKVFSIKRELFLHAPDEIVKKFTEYLVFVNDSSKKGADGKTPQKSFNYLLDLFILIRKDLGYKSTTLKKSDFLKIISSDPSDFEQLLKILEIRD